MNHLERAWNEGIKETARLVALAVIPVVLSGIDPATGAIHIDWRVIGAVALVTVLRAVDRMLHVYNKETKPGMTGESMGLIKTNW